MTFIEYSLLVLSLHSYPFLLLCPFFHFFSFQMSSKKYPTKRRGTSLSLFSPLFFSFLLFFPISFHIPEQRFPNGGKLPRNKKVGQKLNYRTFWTPDLLFFPDNISRLMIGQLGWGFNAACISRGPSDRSTGSRDSGSRIKNEMN